MAKIRFICSSRSHSFWRLQPSPRSFPRLDPLTPGGVRENGACPSARPRYENPYGRLSILNTAGRIDTKGNAFFEPIGTNGRACVTCHQPGRCHEHQRGDDSGALEGNEWKGSALCCYRRHELSRFAGRRSEIAFTAAEQGSDPRFPSVAAAEPPTEAPSSRSSHIEVVRDPTGCNNSPVVWTRTVPRRRYPSIGARARWQT